MATREPSLDAIAAAAMRAIAAAMENMADALGRLADSQEHIAGHLEDLGTKVDEVIATLNSGLDVSVSHPVELEPVMGPFLQAQRLVPELHVQVNDATQIPMIVEAIRKAQEDA